MLVNPIDLPLFDGWTPLILTGLVFLLAQWIYALYGFGSGLLSMALLAFILPDLAQAVVLLLLVNLPTELWVLVKDWRWISFRGVGLVLAGTALGTPLGVLLLKWGAGDERLVVALGAVVLGSAVWLAWQAWGRLPEARQLPALVGWAAGFVGGVLGGLFGSGGPPVILYYQVIGLDKRTFRATLLTLFLVMTLARVPLYLATGLMDGQVLKASMLVLPAGLLGLVLGTRIHSTVPEHRFRQGVALVLGVLGILLLGKGLG